MIEQYRSVGLKLDSQTSSRIIKILAGLVLIVLSFVIFTSSMAKPVVDGEQALCAAGVLLTKGKMIYRDFACAAQMPYHPFLCAAIFKVLNTTHYLLAGRMLTVVCDILVVICIIGIFKRVFASFPITGWLLGMTMAVLYVFNWHIDRFNGFVLNRDFVILCLVVSFWLFVSADFKRRTRYLQIGIMGALLTLATCMHIMAVFIQLLFFVMLLIQPTESGKERFKSVLAFLITPAITLILPIWTMVQAPRAFFINVFEMPIFRWQSMRKFQLMMGGTLYGKFARILACLTVPEGIWPFLIAICVVVLIVLGRRKLEISNLRNAVFAVLMPVIFLIIALCAPAVSYKNFAILVPFIIISFAYPLLYLRRPGKNGSGHKLFRTASIVLIACTFSQVACQSGLLLRTSIIFRPKSWVPMKLHQISEEIAQKTKEPKLIVTLAPLYALEGGCNIYTELSSGWTRCEVASKMSASNRDITHTLNAKTFKELLEKTPPSAIVIDRLRKSPIGLVLLRIAKTEWPEEHYDESIWERKEYPFGVVVYFGL